MKNKTAHFISSTHWDREWYWSQELFRIRLVELIDNLLEIFKKEPLYKYYNMDGQTIPLDDYLQIKPEKEEEIKNLVKKGKLQIGPWYILPDLFLVSGESLVKNLLIGHKMAKKYGNVMSIGYLPDTFNHISQMPQILKGFNFNEYFFMRGMGKEFEKIGTEFWWEAPDGSKVYTLYLIEGYFNAGGLGFRDAFIDFRHLTPDKELAYRNMKEMMDKMIKYYNKSDHFLMLNGSDHTEPQKELPEMLNYLNKKFPDIEFKHSTMQEFMRSTKPENKKLPTYKGEFSGNIHHLDVKSVYSTRMYIKQTNFYCQSLLEKYADPLSSLAHYENLKDFNPNLEYTWKMLLQNHPHDSISGCSIDEVHNDMMNRYARISQIGKYIKDQSIEYLSKMINTETTDGIPVMVYNPMNWERKEVIRAKVNLGKEVLKKNVNYILIDSQNNEIPFTLLRGYKEYSPEINNWQYNNTLEIEFICNVPPAGYKIYYLIEGEKKDNKTIVKAGGNTLENEFYKIIVSGNGGLKITDKRTNKTYTDFNIFEDTEDDGDEYTYSFVEETKTFTSRTSKAKVSLFSQTLSSATLKVEIDFKLPEKLDPSRTKRSRKLISNKIVSYITLSNMDRIDVKTEVENNSIDHRLRVIFPTKYKDYQNSADGHFSIVERDKYFPEKPKEREKVEYYATQHQSNFVTMTDGNSGITVANKGLPEYEILKDNSTLAITLIRCVGYLNKNNIMTRWRMAGPDIATPMAQCNGKNTFDYSIILHAKSWNNSFKSAYNFAYPLDSFTIQKNKGKLKDCMSFIKILPQDMIISVIKTAENGKGIIIRFFNPHSTAIAGELEFYKTIKKCYITNLLEEDMEELKPKDNKVKLRIPKNKIMTLRLI